MMFHELLDRAMPTASVLTTVPMATDSKQFRLTSVMLGNPGSLNCSV